jgi:hypothetical protein
MRKAYLIISLLFISQLTWSQDPITVTSTCGNTNAFGTYNYLGTQGELENVYRKNLGDCSQYTSESECDDYALNYKVYWQNNQWNWVQTYDATCIWLIEECVPAAQTNYPDVILATNPAATPTPPCTGWVVQEPGWCVPDISGCTTLSTETFLFNSFQIYPNPTKGKFSINANEELNIEILDIYGKVVLSQKNLKGLHSFDISNYTDGLYLINLHNNKGSKTYKLIKN